jgi:hypothetical protein
VNKTVALQMGEMPQAKSAKVTSAEKNMAKPSVRNQGKFDEDFSFTYQKVMYVGVKSPVTVVIGKPELKIEGFTTNTAVIPKAKAYTVTLQGVNDGDFKIEPSELKTDAPEDGANVYLEFMVTPLRRGKKQLKYIVQLHDVDSIFGRYLKSQYGEVVIDSKWPDSLKYRIKIWIGLIPWGTVFSGLGSAIAAWFSKHFLDKFKARRKKKANDAPIS